MSEYTVQQPVIASARHPVSAGPVLWNVALAVAVCLVAYQTLGAIATTKPLYLYLRHMVEGSLHQGLARIPILIAAAYVVLIAIQYAAYRLGAMTRSGLRVFVIVISAFTLAALWGDSRLNQSFLTPLERYDLVVTRSDDSITGLFDDLGEENFACVLLGSADKHVLRVLPVDRRRVSRVHERLCKKGYDIEQP
ncbi:MAG: hypothetical protein KKB50_03500 [Planctomycetes bacterium]|nr:hypothetical protein [Planctomycetota bacterium]